MNPRGVTPEAAPDHQNYFRPLAKPPAALDCKERFIPLWMPGMMEANAVSSHLKLTSSCEKEEGNSPCVQTCLSFPAEAVTTLHVF